MEKKGKPIIWLVTFFMFICMLPFESNAFSMEQKKPENALRLTIKYQNDQMTLVKVEPLQMIIPVTIKERVLKENAQSAEEYYFELHDNNENLLLRSSMNNPTISLMEYEDPENPGMIKSSIVKHNVMTFSIIISAIDEVRFVKFLRVVPGQKMLTHEKKKYKNLGTFDVNKAQKKHSKNN